MCERRRRGSNLKEAVGEPEAHRYVRRQRRIRSIRSCASIPSLTLSALRRPYFTVAIPSITTLATVGMISLSLA